jgi:hypothetical protein
MEHLDESIACELYKNLHQIKEHHHTLPTSVIAVLKNPIQLLLFGMGALPVVLHVALVGRK